METFVDVFPTLEDMNGWKDKLNPSIPDINNEEWIALMGRYGSSHIRYTNRTQFMCAFFTIMRENQEKLRKKLELNTKLRSMSVEEALEGEEVITNNATNPDTDPALDAYEPLPYINAQQAQKGKQAPVKGIYALKHSIGGQAYNEFLDGFRMLFRVVLIDEEVVYGQN